MSKLVNRLPGCVGCFLAGGVGLFALTQDVLSQDSDGDSYPDGIEQTLGSDPDDATNHPSSLYRNVSLYLPLDASSTIDSETDDLAGGVSLEVLGEAGMEQGLLGESLMVDGQADGVNGGDRLDPGSTSYTVSLWFKADDVEGVQFIAAKGNATSSQDGWSIWLNGDHLRLRGNHGIDGSSRLTLDKSGVVAGQWHHVVLVIDQEQGKWIGYLDGVSSEEPGRGWSVDAGRTHLFSPGVVFDCDKDLFFGARSDGQQGIGGMIDEAVIVSRAWSADEVGLVMASGLRGYGFGELSDADADGLPDGWELDTFGHLQSSGDDDPDQDQLDNLSELLVLTDPQDSDSDDDLHVDGREWMTGSDPLDAQQVPLSLYDHVQTYHSLDSTTEGASADAIGVYDAALLGDDVRSEAGILGHGLRLPNSGGAERLDFGDVLDSGTESYTVSLWFKTDTVGASVQSIASKGNASSGDDGWMMWLNHDTLVIRGNHGVDGAARLSLRYDGIQAGKWYHVALVIDQESGRWRACLNGSHSAEAGTGWYVPEGMTDSFDSGVDFDNADGLKFGVRSDDSYDFRGYLDDVVVFGRAVQPSDLALVHSAGRLGVSFGRMHDSDHDGMPDWYETLYLGGDGLAGEDPDGDGLSTIEEWVLGARPDMVDTDGDTISDYLEREHGTAAWDAGSRPSIGQLAGMPGYLTREKWNGIGGATIDHLTSSDRFLQAADEVSLVHGTEPPKNEGNNFGVRMRGSLTAVVSGYHSFWIAGDNNFELWLSDGASKFDKRLIAWLEGPEWREHNSTLFRDWDRYGTQRSKRIWLQAGQSYFFEVLHKERSGSDFVSVAWQQPGGERELIPAEVLSSYVPDPDDLDEDYLPDTWEVSVGLDGSDNGAGDTRQGEFGDFDADGLSNREEYLLGTNPTDVDTDGDGVADFAEVHQYGSDPTRVDMAAAVQYLSQDPQQYAGSTGTWQVNADGGLLAEQSRGGIDYTIQIADPGIYIIKLAGCAIGQELGDERLPLDFSIDGIYLGRRILRSSAGGQGEVEILTCYLQSGQHSLSIFNQSTHVYASLQIDALDVLKPGGVDADANGMADWLDDQLARDNAVAVCPAESLTSPVFVEGQTWHFEALAITAGDEAQLPIQGLDYGWYADLDLPENGALMIDFSFENGAVTEQKSVTWVSTNSLAHQTLIIRKDDRLKLDAWRPGGATDGGTVSYQLNGQPLESKTSGVPYIHRFESAGVHTLVTSHTAPDATVTSNTLTIKVLAAEFGDPAVALSLFSYDWEVPGVGSDVYVEPDSRILFGENDPLDGGGRSFRITPMAADTRYLLARLEEGGPVLARGTIEGFYVAGGLETADGSVVHTYEDGTRLVRSSLVMTGLPPGGFIRIQINTSGVTALDGSNYVYLDADDFDHQGIGHAFFEIAPGSALKVCHFIQIFDAEGQLMN